MKNLLKIYAALLLVLTGTGCFSLDKMPLDTISDQAVFKDEALTMAYMYNIYGYMPCGYGVSTVPRVDVVRTGGLGLTDLLDGSTDLLRSPAMWNESNGVMIPGTISPTYNPMEVWANRYEVIRKVNNLLAHTGEGSVLDESFRLRVRAEARFVRAWMYFDLVRRYGPVPLIEELQNYEDPQSLLVARDPVEDIYDFIYRELDEISREGLPHAREMSASEMGRASKEAAWALNGRAMLFAGRWKESAECSACVLESGYHQLNPDYNALFQSKGGDPEVIFEVIFDGVNKGHAADMLYMPPSLDNGWGAQSCPTQELVDSYEMLDGSPFDWSNPEHAANPYEGRDKRLQWSIIIDGSEFKGKIIRTAYLVPDDGLGLIERTNTGYYIRKFLDETLPFEKLVGYGGSSTSWKEIRLAEVLLNYAEALNELHGGPDPEGEAYEAMRRVRERAGLPALPDGLDYTAFKERVIQERKVELAFEGHRFWDLRRWRLAESVLNDKYFHGMRITEDTSGKKTYDIFEINSVPKQVFLEKHYLMPINQGEIEKNPNLLPNNGY